jgi:hypothetical protein
MSAIKHRSETQPNQENFMNTTFQSSPVRIDNVLSAIVIAVAVGFAGYGALASMLAPLAA